MLIAETILAAILATKKVPPKQTTLPVKPVADAPVGAELAHDIKTDLESIAGPGSVDISIDHETLFSVRIAVPDLSSDMCYPIFDRELKLYRLFPDYSFDFYLRPKARP
ncbi:MAG: hypothetical protein KGN84_00975 [Acidobacteriota bacterium]|nr:hypothetical protein [Acidobacteriota bacterium]